MGMNVVSTVALFYALLAVFANVFVIGLLGLWFASRRSASASGWLDATRSSLGPISLIGAFVVAGLAMGGSLYFSEVAHFEPCKLCWFQRIFMYPLVFILGIAARHGDVGVRRYAAPLAVIGAVISIVHYTMEWFPSLDSGVCSATAPCTVIWFRQLGFVTLPYLALSAFLLILALLAIARAPEPEVDSGLAGAPDVLELEPASDGTAR